MKLVYILGAGASAQAIPTYKDFNKYLKRYSNMLSHLLIGQSNPLDGNLVNPDYISLHTIIQSLTRECAYYGTADTLAVAYRQDISTLNSLKALISTFIYYQHFELKNDIKNLMFTNFKGNLTQYGNQIDRRYVRFWASLLGGTKDKLPDSIKFVCWNYDFQIKAALHHFTNDTTQISNYISSNVVFLNGSCLLDPLEDYHHPTTLSPQHLDKIIHQLQNPESTGIKFSWEEGSSSVADAVKLLKEADAAVFIGYSFPDYNRSVDIKLLEALNGSIPQSV